MALNILMFSTLVLDQPLSFRDKQGGLAFSSHLSSTVYAGLSTFVDLFQAKSCIHPATISQLLSQLPTRTAGHIACSCPEPSYAEVVAAMWWLKYNSCKSRGDCRILAEIVK